MTTHKEQGDPVAWMRDDEMKAMVSDEKKAWILLGQSKLIEDYNKPLYTTPPQRTWVGLTDEQLADCVPEGAQIIERDGEQRRVAMTRQQLHEFVKAANCIKDNT